jgi:hypothetical protein
MSSDGLEIIQVEGATTYLVDAPVPKPGGGVRLGKLGLLKSHLASIAHRGEATVTAEFFGQVLTGTILTRHIFRGLQRSLLVDEDREADRNIWIYSRKPAIDWVWNRDRCELLRVDLQTPDCVFVVLVSPNKQPEKFPLIDGWIHHWAWIHEDRGLSEAPIGWVDRYERKLWTMQPGGVL